MCVKLKSTSGFASNGVKLLVYGSAGTGKTTLIKTLPSPVIISAEGGLMSLRDCDIPYVEVKSLAEMGEVYKWLRDSEEAAQFKSVALDSISEIAEVVLAGEKNVTKDGRMAYGQMGDKMTALIRSFRDLPNRNIYFSAKIEKAQTESGAMLYQPSMPGQKISRDLPYFFDEVLALRIVDGDDGEPIRILQCESTYEYIAKDRSGKLSATEDADLGAVIEKITGKSDG